MLIGHDRLGGHAAADGVHEAQAALVCRPVAAALAAGARGAVGPDVQVRGAGLERDLDGVMKDGQLVAQGVRHAAEATRGTRGGCPERGRQEHGRQAQPGTERQARVGHGPEVTSGGDARMAG